MGAILVVGDPHIGKGGNLGKQTVGSIYNSRIVDQFKLLDWIYEQAIINNVKHIVLTGDVFDEPKPHYNLLVLFIDWLYKCVDDNINVHIIVGNHDILRSGQLITSPLDIIHALEINNVFLYKRITTLHLDNVGITFLPFRDRRSFNTDLNSSALNVLKSQIPYQSTSIGDTCMKVLIGHLALEGAIPVAFELDELSNELFCPLDMFDSYDIVLMGHIHKFQIMSEKPHIAHIGSMDISDFGETEHTKYIAIIDPSKSNKVKYLALPTRKLHHIIINLPEYEIDFFNFIENQISQIENIQNSIVKITIILPNSTSQLIDRNIIEKIVYKHGAFHISKISEERKFVSIKNKIQSTIDNTINEMSAIKTYASCVDDHLREDFVNLASNIINEYKFNLK